MLCFPLCMDVFAWVTCVVDWFGGLCWCFAVWIVAGSLGLICFVCFWWWAVMLCFVALLRFVVGGDLVFVLGLLFVVFCSC